MNFAKKVLVFRRIFPLLLLLFPSSGFAQHYIQTNLVSSIPGVGTNPTNPLDTQLINAWGLARNATSPWWISDNGTGVSTIYNGAGTKRPLVVTIPVPPGGSPPSAPTGVVVNGTTDFVLPGGMPAIFIFVTEDGIIAGWNSGTDAVIIKDNSKNEAIYKGVTIAEWNGKHYLYVANFHSGEIEVYDSAFQRVSPGENAFTDDDDDNDDAPVGKDDKKDRDDHGDKDDNDHGDNKSKDNNTHFAPFNVQAIGTNVYVAFAKQDADKKDEVAGAGLGFVDVFDPAGRRLARLQRGSWFNAPWGIAMAPGEFGEFSHALLIGMFGSGQIAGFNPINGAFLGVMKNPNDSVLTIDGLWALGFGAGNSNSGPHNTLFFTAGPNDENDGLFGTLVPIPAELLEVDEP